MDIHARKYQLIEKVMHLDEDQIRDLENFLADVSETKLVASLDRALQQVEDGQVTPHSAVRKKYEKWL